MTTAEIQLFALPRQCELNFPVPVTPRGYMYITRAIVTCLTDTAHQKIKQNKIANVTLQNTYYHVKEPLLSPDKRWFDH